MLDRYPHNEIDFDREPSMLFSLLRRFLKLHLFRITTRPLIEQPHVTAAMRLRTVDEAELLPYCGDAAIQLPISHVRAAFARGDRCAVAYDGTRLVGYEWFAHGPTPHIDGVWVAFDGNARYGYKQFVRLQYRGQRIAAALSTHADNWYRRIGCTHAISLIDLGNGASWRSERRIGAHTAGYAGYIHLFGRFIAFSTPGATRLKLRFYSPRRERPNSEALRHSSYE